MHVSTVFEIPSKSIENFAAEVFAFFYTCDLESSSSLFRLEFNSIYHHNKFEPNQFINVRMHANVKVLFAAVTKSHSKVVSGFKL